MHGTGETPCSATALGVAFMHRGERVRICAERVDLVDQLEQEKQQARTAISRARLCRPSVRRRDAVDGGLGYLPCPASGGALLFHLIGPACKKTSGC